MSISNDKGYRIVLNKFVASLPLWYNNSKGEYFNEFNQLVEKPYEYIKNAYKEKFRENIGTKELAYIKGILELPYDFDNIPYKTYLKELQAKQQPSLVTNLKDCYSNYLESIQDKSESKQVIYIQGLGGTGKTTYAKIIAEQYFSKDEIYITSGGDNPFDEYYGEKCIIIDDFRDSMMKLNDLLKLLDNNTNSNVGARYHNKNLARCKVIILTSVIKVEDIYINASEDRFQIYRRINYMQITGDLKINVTLKLYEYNKSENKYICTQTAIITQQIKDYIANNQKESVIDINKLFTINENNDKIEIHYHKELVSEEDLPF